VIQRASNKSRNKFIMILKKPPPQAVLFNVGGNVKISREVIRELRISQINGPKQNNDIPIKNT
ncbi:MAG: hypothetical protein JXJ22_09750, partial [Bacteroidales bacterium]|nr:hypothetical protein [Bacteroidales bacterium]